MNNLTSKSTLEEINSYYSKVEEKLMVALSDVPYIEAPFGSSISIDLSLVEATEYGGECKKYIFTKPKINLEWRR